MSWVQFGKPIIEHQLVRAKLARMVMLAEASRSMVYRVTSMVNDYVKGMLGPRAFAALSSATKAFVANSATEVLDEAIQVRGSYGYMGEFYEVLV
jgi:alkylation response protein AidB-like acyl-CoA dehydrogenase